MQNEVELAEDIKRKYRDLFIKALRDTREFKSVAISRNGKHILVENYDEVIYEFSLKMRAYELQGEENGESES